MKRNPMNLALTSAGLAVPRHITRGVRTHDMMTYDQQTVDSSGAFLIGELERLDQTLHLPLTTVTWSRDITLRTDVSMADEMTSFTQTQFAAAGGPSPVGKNWIGKTTTAIPGIAVDINKTPNPLALWGIELGWTIPELESSIKVGRPIDQQKYAGMQLKWNMDTDEQVYIGDPILGVPGLVNNPNVPVANALTGNWATATPKQILDDINAMLTTSWTATGFRYAPRRIGLPPAKYAQLVSRMISDLGTMSILNYVKDNAISTAQNGVPLEIVPIKWLTGRGTGGTDRMIAYTNDNGLVRFPMVPLQRTPLQYRGIHQLAYYFGKLGVVEVVYEETIAYVDGI